MVGRDGEEKCGRGGITDMSWRALLMAASCCTCLNRADLGSEEALREEFRVSMRVRMSKRQEAIRLALNLLISLPDSRHVEYVDVRMFPRLILTLGPTLAPSLGCTFP